MAGGGVEEFSDGRRGSRRVNIGRRGIRRV
jgi:hypothetical protein